MCLPYHPCNDGGNPREAAIHPDTTSPIGIYVRVSSRAGREEERFHSPREQAERATALVVARGLTPGPTYEDIDVSGATPPMQRPAMGRLLRDLEAGRLAGIAAFSLDRLSRDPAHGDALVKEVTRAGGVILTPDIPDAIDTPTGEFTFGMLLQVARLYRSQAKARFEAAKERATLAGIPVGRVPFGYRQDEERRLEVNPDTAGIVRELFERRSAGAGLNTLALLLGERTGRPWSRGAVVAMLKNRVYTTGRLTYSGTVSEWEAGGIIDEALFQAAQVKYPDHRPPRAEHSTWLLTGFLKCANCGYSLSPTATNSGRGGPKRRYYRCVNHRCDVKGAARADILERWVILESFSVGDELEVRASTAGLGELEEALTVAERRYNQVRTPEVRDALGDDWAADVKARRMERDEAAAALGRARAEQGNPAQDLRLRDIWDDLDLPSRREALRMYWKAIHVGKRKPGEGTPIRLVATGPGIEAALARPPTTLKDGE